MTSSAISPVFGRIVVAAQIEQHVTQTLQKWFPTYIREIEAQAGLSVGVIPPPANYTSRNSLDALAGELIPKCVVISPGLADAPIRDGEGWYRAQWQLGVGVTTAQPTEEDAMLHTDIYGGAARALILQQVCDGDLISSVQFVNESYDDLPITNQVQLYRAASVFFVVDVDNVVNRWKGPEVPDDDPYDYGQAQTVEVDVINEGMEALPDL